MQGCTKSPVFEAVFITAVTLNYVISMLNMAVFDQTESYIDVSGEMFLFSPQREFRTLKFMPPFTLKLELRLDYSHKPQSECIQRQYAVSLRLCRYKPEDRRQPPFTV
jgi:hypothetical protein